MAFIPTTLDIFLALLGLVILKRYLDKTRQGPLPPGPRGLPLVGNVLDIPSEQEWLTFAKWGDIYGDICSITALGQTIVIVNSPKVASDMLEKKSLIYADRPVLQMGGELVGWKNTLVLLPYGNRFRRFRKLFHNLIGTPAIVRQYYPAQEIEVKQFLRRIMRSPEKLQEHIRKSTGAVVLRVAYGYEIQEEEDPFIQLADEATEQFAVSTAPGGFLVDAIPLLRHVPDWMPGADFKRKAKAWWETLDSMVEKPYEFVKQQMRLGHAEKSFTSTMLENKELSPQEESDLKWSAASFYTGAADTTVSAQYAFFLAMTLYPEAAMKAQAEIDHVVGNDRLPTFNDRDNLPYVEALVKEVLRWNSVVPTSVPHRSMQDDVHEGYFIPKGSLVIANIWKIMHDPRTYQDPMRFNPDRFMGCNPELDPRQATFGYGRRSCPGMHLADATLFLTCVSVLATFEITKSVVNGVTIEPVHENTTGTISHPKPFKCDIKPRSAKAVGLVQAEGH